MTTRYESLEDRICLTGETDTGDTVRLWLTRRLLDGLLPPVFRWLEKTGTAAEGAAARPSSAGAPAGARDPGPAGVGAGGGNPAGGSDTATPQQPVQEDQITHEWLVRKISLSGGNRGIRLTFTPAEREAEGDDDDDAGSVILVLETAAARQWIVILHRHFRKAGWPVKEWPAWLLDPAQESPASVKGSKVLH